MSEEIKTWEDGWKEWGEGCKPKPLQPNQLNFYEYKWIRQLLMDIAEFQKKNSPNGMMTDHKEPIPYFVYKCDPNYLQMLVDKMTKRMKEFEPWVSRETTAHCGYWEV